MHTYNRHIKSRYMENYVYVYMYDYKWAFKKLSNKFMLVEYSIVALICFICNATISFSRSKE